MLHDSIVLHNMTKYGIHTYKDMCLHIYICVDVIYIYAYVVICKLIYVHIYIYIYVHIFGRGYCSMAGDLINLIEDVKEPRKSFLHLAFAEEGLGFRTVGFRAQGSGFGV